MENVTVASVIANIERRRKEKYEEEEKKGPIRNPYSQKSFAEKSGISLTTYKNYLTGKTDSITLRTICKMAYLLGYEPWTFLEMEE